MEIDRSVIVVDAPIHLKNGLELQVIDVIVRWLICELNGLRKLEI